MCRTEQNVKDESELLRIAYEYKDESDMVWIASESVKIRNGFPWHFRTEGSGKTSIHISLKQDAEVAELLVGEI